MQIDELSELDDLQSRLKLDFQVVSQLYSPLMEVDAYRNVDDLRARRNPVTSIADGNRATHYRVTYHLRTLTGPGAYSPATTVHFDLLANTDYPQREPSCFVIDSAVPWSPHFATNGWICIGKIWENSDGNMLLGDLLIHVAKLLNFDEPDYIDVDYGGFRPEAVRYWTEKLNRQPLTRNLRYPTIVLPEEPAVPTPPSPPPPPIIIKRRSVTPPQINADAQPRIRLKRIPPVQNASRRIRIHPSTK